MSWYGFGHDPDVPAGYQDADIEMQELYERAAELEAEAEGDDFEDVFECGCPAAYVRDEGQHQPGCVKL